MRDHTTNFDALRAVSEATARAYEHLGIAPKSKASDAQPSLFQDQR